MYKFIYVFDIHGRRYLINVSEIVWIEESMPDRGLLKMRFEDGSTLTVHNTKEILEMLILKPWQMNLLNFFRWLFKGGKRCVNGKHVR